MKRARTIAGLVLSLCAACGMHAQTPQGGRAGTAASQMPLALQNVGFEPELNAQMPLGLAFRDETGKGVTLRDYFGHKPVVLAFVYYSCPMLCDQVQQGVVGSLRMISFNPGRDYDVVFISFDPSETSYMAAAKKKLDLSHFHRPETEAGWHFLTGPKESIEAVTKAANFRYSFDNKSNTFAHASGVMLLTPDGRISRYFYGVEYPGRDMRLGLVDASAGKIGSPVDHVLLFCFHYDPSTATYSASILKLIRLGGVLTILALVIGFVIFRRRDANSAGPGRGGSESSLRKSTEQGAH